MVDRDAARAQQIAQYYPVNGCDCTLTTDHCSACDALTAAIAQALAEVRAEMDAQVREVLETILRADSTATIGEIKVDIPDGWYPRQYLQAAVSGLLAPPAPERREEQP